MPQRSGKDIVNASMSDFGISSSNATDMRILQRALEAAWRKLRIRQDPFASRDHEIFTRERLARIIEADAAHGERNPATLANQAVEVFDKAYRRST